MAIVFAKTCWHVRKKHHLSQYYAKNLVSVLQGYFLRAKNYNNWSLQQALFLDKTLGVAWLYFSLKLAGILENNMLN